MVKIGSSVIKDTLVGWRWVVYEYEEVEGPELITSFNTLSEGWELTQIAAALRASSDHLKYLREKKLS